MMKNTTDLSINKGFSLVEVMIASAIFAIATAGTLHAVTTAQRIYQHQAKLTQAINIAEAVLEGSILLNKEDVVSGGPFCFGREGQQQLTCGSDSFRANITVTDGVPLALMREVKVTVDWDEFSGNKSLSLLTFRN